MVMLCLERTACCFLAAWVCVALAGCGGQSGVVATGTVLDGGKPVPIPDYEEEENCLEVEFFPLDEAGELINAPSYSADVKEDGTFEVKGPMGEGIPPGKYRVAVSRVSEEEEDEEERPGADPWAKFDKENSPFEFEVPGDEILIDLSEAGD